MNELDLFGGEIPEHQNLALEHLSLGGNFIQYHFLNGGDYTKFIEVDKLLTEKYRSILLEYFQKNISKTKSICRNTLVPDFLQPELELTNENLFSAEAVIEFKSKVIFTFGAYLALNDVFHRLVTNADFFSVAITKNNSTRFWSGSECRWMGKSKRYIKKRYIDYSSIEESIISNRDIEKIIVKTPIETSIDIGIAPTLLGRFLYSFPFDRSRLELCNSMMQIAQMWVLFHEEAHLFRGHLGLLNAVADVQNLGLAKPSISEQDKQTRKILHLAEWDADRVATADIMSMLCNQFASDKIFGNKYPGRNAENTIRIILTSIGITCLIFERQKIYYGQNKLYPNPRVRIFGVCLAIVNHFVQYSINNFEEIISPNEIREIMSNALLCSLNDIRIAADILLTEEIEDLHKSQIFLHSGEIPLVLNYILFHKNGDKVNEAAGYSENSVKTIRDEWFSQSEVLMAEYEDFRKSCEPYSVISTLTGEFRKECLFSNPYVVR
ncbi:MAG: hypothetical protein ABJO52_20940 [Nisaea sp.]|uniref:hypothetical protein n=1 Tax=Nisaea sp. TaxID=2024842 RepID=UPI003297A69F